MKPLLLVLNPRRIPECVDAISSLPIDQAWLTNYTEYELKEIVPSVIASTDHDVIGVLSDDTVPTPYALSAVLDLVDPSMVTTGWCRLDERSPYVNLSTEPLATSTPTSSAYHFPTIDYVLDYDQPSLPTYFAGHCLTFMSRDLWRDFPWDCHGGPPGYASDLSLSYRLGEAGVKIRAARDGEVLHVKRRWNYIDDTPGRELLIGKEPSAVRWALQGGTP